MILAGDIGGTKTVLALYKKNDQGILQCEYEQTFASTDYPQFEDILSIFLSKSISITSACFGIAGPIINQRCQTTNLPWTIDAEDLARKLSTKRVKLLNDLEAMALGMLNIPDEDLIELNPNAVHKKGNIAVLAAGTGLGEAILYWDGKQHRPIATEGGHTDFAAQSEQQDQLLAYLRKHFDGHVSWERILSGNGFGHIYDFLVNQGLAPACPEVPPVNSPNSFQNDRNAIISRLGSQNEDPVCAEVVRLFVELYGSEAGNLALKSMATGGIFIGGGIAPKILKAIQTGDFLRAFTNKGRFNSLLNEISIKLSVNPNTPIIGAANYFSND